MIKLQQLLARRTNSLDYIAEIDGFRFLAIGSVILFHICEFLQYKIYAGTPELYKNNYLFWFVKQGGYGVELFFVISGFVLSLPFVMAYDGRRPPIRLKDYFLRRVTRLEPPYLFNLTLILIPYAFLKGYNFDLLFPHYLARVCYCHNWIYPGQELINPVAWSLEIEIQFYILVPLLTRLYVIKRHAVRRCVLVGVALLFVVVQNNWLPADTAPSIVGYIQYFLMGFLLADFYVHDWNLKPQKFYGADWWATLAVTTILALVGWGGFVCKALLPIAFFFFCGMALRAPKWGGLLSHGWVPVIGGMCYTIYLYHYQITYLVAPRLVGGSGQASFWWNFSVVALVVIPITLLACSLLFLFVEKPCMDRRWPTRLWRWLWHRNVKAI